MIRYQGDLKMAAANTFINIYRISISKEGTIVATVSFEKSFLKDEINLRKRSINISYACCGSVRGSFLLC